MRFAPKLYNNMSKLIHNEVYKYTAPAWCKQLKKSPTHRVQLAVLPTPIHPWKVPGLPSDVNLSIKRDDLTGSSLSGNKVRKLEFLLADALEKGCGSVITCGALQSNHCRATVAAAAQLGLQSHLVLRSEKDASEIVSCGNIFLSQMCGANLYLIPKHAKYETEIKQRQDILAEEILKKTGKPAYPICIGGSDCVGLHGYLNAWEEMIQQEVQDDYDDIVVTCGSGGTISGIAIGNYLTGSKVKLHAVIVCDDAKYFHDHINAIIKKVGLENVKSESIVDIIEGYKGAGYGASTSEDHDFYRKIANSSGIFCDPVYSGKGVKGLLNELQTNRQRFKGDRVLFVHTGGIFGLYDGRMFETDSTKVHDWKNLDKDPKDFFK